MRGYATIKLEEHTIISREENYMQVTLTAFPAGIAEFKAAAQMGLSAPENTCALFLCALELYIKNDEGVEAMNMLRGPRPMTPYDVQFLRDRLRGREYLPRAYFNGATPQSRTRGRKGVAA